MAEFKKLSAVEAVASVSDTANVLIEEDGVIKRAPKTAVGGAGGGSDIYYVFLENGNVTTSEGLYDAIVENLFNNIKGIVVRTFWIKYDDHRVHEFYVENFYYNPEDEDEHIIITCGAGMIFYIYKNGNHSYYYD